MRRDLARWTSLIEVAATRGGLKYFFNQLADSTKIA
jgi:hypothetical protein